MVPIPLYSLKPIYDIFLHFLDLHRPFCMLFGLKDKQILPKNIFISDEQHSFIDEIHSDLICIQF